MDVRGVVSPGGSTSRADEEQDNIALLRDAVPQLESLFVISQCIGHGTFSSVYLARTKHTTTINGRHHFAIKHIIPTSHPSRVYMELKCLKLIGGLDNVMGVTMCFREMNHVVLVMPYFPHDSFADYVGCLTIAELQDYLRNLLIALRRVHSFGIIHRDVKPANFLYNRKQQRYSLVDFGLAQEVSQIKTSAMHGNLARLNRARIEAANQMLTPPTVETPHHPANKTVKRKLVVSPGEPTEAEKSVKRARQGSPPSTSVSSILSTTTNRVNTALRRSPRKQCSIAPSPKKENFELMGTPRKVTIQSSNVQQDSPSKHTRNAEANRRLESPDFNANKTPVAKAEIRDISSTSNESSLASKSFTQRHRQMSSVTALSARVPRIAKAFQQKQGPSTAFRDVRVLQEVQTRKGAMLQPVSCKCYGHPRVCSVCVTRTNQVAPRAGTPGFRAPEVLLRHPDQGTAVDMWSVGVILLCLLSGRYPFFRAVDDLSTLAEIATLLGTQVMKKTAAHLGKLFTCSETRNPLDLMKVCEILRSNSRRSNINTDKETLPQPCPSCYQQDMCVCLIPPTKATTSQNASGQSSKKRSQAQERHQPLKTPGAHRKGSTLVGVSSTSRTEPEVVAISKKAQEQIQVQPQGPTTTTPKEEEQTRAPASDSSCIVVTPSSSCKKMQPEPELPRDSLEVIEVKIKEDRHCNAVAAAYPPLVYHLLIRLLDPNPDTRITAQEALDHPFLKCPLG
ncbi:cell division cycle 7-related protein kinase-like isoform X3 [Penaeus chinensis]|uniref:cell division cycle 7-related protein kinase-like isoform X3 n=1 Tax=Penaeus chinensis TaxID=139456 RepID=UPI001FB57420|nr:cell division cycle 7-related protein kinase-like isoform X3 [Penaeus chinensis]